MIQTQQVQLSFFPEEILEQILYLVWGSGHSALHLVKVCRRWHILAEPLLFRRLVFLFNSLPTTRQTRKADRTKAKNQALLARLRAQPRLWRCIRWLRLTTRFELSEEDIESATEILKNVSVLRLELHGNVPEPLRSNIPVLTPVKEMVLSGRWLSLILDPLLRGCANYSLKFLKMHCAVYDYRNPENYACPKPILPKPTGHVHLDHLELDGEGWTHEHVERILPWCLGLKSLTIRTKKVYRYSDCGVNRVKEPGLLNLFKNTLENLELTNMPQGDETDPLSGVTDLSDFKYLRRLKLHKQALFSIRPGEARKRIPVDLDSLSINMAYESHEGGHGYQDLSSSEKEWLLEFVQLGKDASGLTHIEIVYHWPDDVIQDWLKLPNWARIDPTAWPSMNVNTAADEFRKLGVDITWPGPTSKALDGDIRENVHRGLVDF